MNFAIIAFVVYSCYAVYILNKVPNKFDELVAEHSELFVYTKRGIRRTVMLFLLTLLGYFVLIPIVIVNNLFKGVRNVFK